MLSSNLLLSGTRLTMRASPRFSFLHTSKKKIKQNIQTSVIEFLLTILPGAKLMICFYLCPFEFLLRLWTPDIFLFNDVTGHFGEEQLDDETPSS